MTNKRGGENMNTGVLIKSYLSKNGMSQTYVSEKTGIDLPKLNMALNGKRRLTFREYEYICWALKLNTDYFLKPRRPPGKEG